MQDHRVRVECAGPVKVEGLDWNCPPLITERFTPDEVRVVVEPSRAHSVELEAQPVLGPMWKSET